LIEVISAALNCCYIGAVLRYVVVVFTTKLVCESNKFDAFITIYGGRGDTGQRRLRESLTYSSPFAANQVDVFFFEVVHLGKLQHVLLEFRSYGRGRICWILLFYCERMNIFEIWITCICCL